MWNDFLGIHTRVHVIADVGAPHGVGIYVLVNKTNVPLSRSVKNEEED